MLSSVLPLLILCIATVLSSSTPTSQRGIIAANKHLYTPTSDGKFACRDGEKRIPFSSVNDDYCDCADGTDEPGTSACPTGVFLCENVGHITLSIPSSRVNDGICDQDCCDGSDEYDGRVTCPNICDEAGRVARESAQKSRNVAQEGAKLRKAYLETIMVAGDSKEKAEQLRADVMALETSVEAFRVARDDTQTIEDQLRTSWYDNAKQAEFIAYELIGLRNATKELVESVQELVEHVENGKDVKELLKHLKEGVEKVEKVPRGDITVVTAAQLEAAENATRFARDQYDAWNDDLTTRKNELSALDKNSNADFGPDGSMGMLEGCMDHDTPEYTYEICFFDSATQKAKNGGSVSLGAWKGWTGKDLTQFSGKDLKYTEAKFEGGLGCWNGPDRSLTVTLECGVEKAVLAFSEPNKCEYAAKVSTPALCEADLEDEGVTEEIGVKRGVDHDEL